MSWIFCMKRSIFKYLSLHSIWAGKKWRYSTFCACTFCIGGGAFLDKIRKIYTHQHCDIEIRSIYRISIICLCTLYINWTVLLLMWASFCWRDKLSLNCNLTTLAINCSIISRILIFDDEGKLFYFFHNPMNRKTSMLQYRYIFRPICYRS